MSVKLEGFDEFFDWASDAPQEIKEEVHKVIKQAGASIEREAKSLAPVDTGRLRGSITSKNNSSGQYMSVEIGTDVEYAEHVEFGTYKTKAQPFLFPAYNAQEQRIINDLNKAVGRGVD